MNEKNKLRIGIILDSVERLEINDDTSLLLFTELKSRGHRLFYIKPEDIYSSNGKLMIKLNYAEYDNNFELKKTEIKNEEAKSLDAILIRLEPPYDINYIFLNQMLASLRENVFFFNDPKALTSTSEKLYILDYPKYIPPTLVSRDILRLKHFVLSHQKTIIKQLDLYASKNLMTLTSKTKEPHLYLEKATDNGKRYVMAQEFIPAIHSEGDKRIIFLEGKILGCYRRVPEEGNFRSDPDFGGKNDTAELSEKEMKVSLEIAKKSLKKGIYFGGIDMIGGFLTEINITCPAGIITLNQLYGLKLHEEIASFIEKNAYERKKDR
ncbi:MAG: hypothetical protein D6734_08865 [Candidatus Schekmanbacteria bacterium]|nr:MAG: hypothetical protein D6734_08865 [Candidatus Schekmanbacteria bacterium]